MGGNIQQNFSNGTVGSWALCNDHCRKVLATLNSVVLVGGTASSVMLSRSLFRRNSQSTITIIITNIIVLHGLFLASLPFRLGYYFLWEWRFGRFACRAVSSMVHFHMYLTLVFYVATVGVRLLTYFKRLPAPQLPKCQAVAWSATIWLLGTLTFSRVFRFHYGTHTASSPTHCFQFPRELNLTSVVAIDYCAIGVLVLSLIRLVVTARLSRPLRASVLMRQEFRAHGNSFFFLLVIVVCFLPHHVFRAFFIQNYCRDQKPELVLYGEICKALTAVCGLDVLCFAAGGLVH